MVDEVGRHIAAGERMKNNNPLAIWGHSADAISVVYRQGRSTIFRMPIYPMLNQWNANPMTPNPTL